MRALLTSLALLFSLSACAALPAPPRHTTPMAPLRAWISPPGTFGGLAFYVNRPAHVAVFEIIPGRGIGMMYPSYGAGQAHLVAGMHTVWTGMSSFRWAYQSTLGDYRGSQPRFYYLVASEAPLRISHFQASSMALRSTIGWQQFTAWNSYSAMEELTRLILPMQDWGEWTTDLYVDWPDPPVREMPRYVVVTCRDGRQLMVPVGYGFSACPGDRAMPLPTEGTGEADGDVEVPTRRRPQPAAGDRRVADSPRWRPEATDPQTADEPAPRRREPEARRERESERSRPVRTRAADEDRRAEPRGRETRGVEPRSEPRSAPPPRSQEPRAEPRSEPRPAPPPRSEPRRDPVPERERPAEPPPVML